MATDTRAHTSLTLADLCQAIADGSLPYALRDDHYYITARVVRHLSETKPARQTVAQPGVFIEHCTDIPSLNIGCSA